MIAPIVLLYFHFVGDFLLQSRRIARTKSSSVRSLGIHITILAIAYVIAIGLLEFLGLFDSAGTIPFLLINLVGHAVIDWYVWRIYKWTVVARFSGGTHYTGQDFQGTALISPEFKYYEDQWFYWTIGLDQFLHAAILIGSYMAWGAV